MGSQGPPCALLHLPVEVLAEVFLYIPTHYPPRLQALHRKLRQSLTLLLERSVDEAVWNGRGLLRLPKFSLFNHRRVFCHLSEMSTLSLERIQEIDFLWKGPTDEISIQLLAHAARPHNDPLKDLTPVLPGLHSVTIQEASLSPVGVSALTSLTSIQALTLHRSKVTDLQLGALSGLCNLASLDLSMTTTLTSSCVDALAKMVSLKLLSLAGCSQLNYKWIKGIIALRQLEFLDLSDCVHLFDEQAKTLHSMPNLRTLFMAGCFSISDETIIELASRSASLTELNLRGCCKVTDAALKVLATENRLKVLNCAYNSSITDVGVSLFLRPGSSLKRVDVSGCGELSEEMIALARSLHDQ